MFFYTTQNWSFYVALAVLQKTNDIKYMRENYSETWITSGCRSAILFVKTCLRHGYILKKVRFLVSQKQKENKAF